MSELSFAKTLLGLLDSRPQKLQPDWSLNPKQLELHGSYTLPKMPKPMAKPESDGATTSATPSALSLPIVLKSSRNPVLELKVPDIDPSVETVLSLKERVAKDLQLEGVGKIKILWQKKPVSDAKTLMEVLGEKPTASANEPVEFGVMVMGYKTPEAAAGGTAAEGDKMDVDRSSAKVTVDEVFWDDLRGFLEQRLKNENTAKEMLNSFQGAWAAR